jgi:hypothetical protein
MRFAFLLVYAVATCVIVVTGVMQPEHRTFAVVFFGLGLLGTWKHYVNWRRAR